MEDPAASAMGLMVPAHYLRFVLDTAAEKGADVAELCAAAGIAPQLLDDVRSSTPIATASALYEHAARRTGDDAFGLHVAERSDFYAFDALGFAIATKRNLREAFERLAPAIMTLQGTHIELDVTGDVTTYLCELPEEGVMPCRHRTEAYLARVVRTIELATGARPHLHSVSFRHAAPRDTSEHERIFAAPVAFGAARNGFVLDSAVLAAPFTRSDRRLSRVLDQHVRDLVASRPVDVGLVDRVRRYVREAFPHGDYGVEAIGRRVALSGCTLQRRLSEEGSSHRQIVEQVRHELALHYLVETRLPIKEIADLLGYSELRAFYRAFERWTGLPPAAYRSRARTGSLR